MLASSRTAQGTQTDRSGESPLTQNRVAFDVSRVDPNAVSHSGTGACSQSLLNPNSGTRLAEKTKTDKYKPLCQLPGMAFVPIILAASDGMGNQFQRQ